MRLQLNRLHTWTSSSRRAPSYAGLLLLCALLSVLAPSAPSAADEASGDWTGSLSLRGNYYWERSTRVHAPAVSGALVSPSGVRVEATYMLDAITSASQATGVQSDVSFTERRNDVSAGLGYELDLGDAQLDFSVRGRFSKEPDYKSRGLGFGLAWSLNQRNTVISINGYYVHDDVLRVVRMAPADDPTRLMADDPVPVGTLDVLSLGLSWEQVLSRTSWLILGYDAALLEGFQANPYRVAAFQDGGGAPENHPDSRVREAVYAWFAQYIRATRSALRLGYRVYRDSWDILAHAPEARIYQELGPHLELRLRYRYYTQSDSFFNRPRGNRRSDPYVTADPKMTAFHDQTLGLKLRLAFEFLSFTPLDFLHTAALDFGVEYVFNTNRYGDGLIGQGGLSWSF